MEISEKEMVRINETIDIIPRGVSSILEVGCGDGRVSKKLHNNCNLTGIDIEPIRIKLYPGNKLIGDISNLPIKSRQFDMVLACEVLEHLDHETMLFALDEIQRVAKRYILITVPFKETLSAQWHKCSKCNHIFHGWGHLRQFDMALLENLFSVPLIEKRFLGPKESRIPSLGYVMAKKVGNVWNSDNTKKQLPCPKCGSEPMKSEGNMFGKLFIRFLWRIERISPFKKPIWIGCLYQLP
jgi:SAM-dependent methyltransferase